MNREILEYIRKHRSLYQLLREDSSYYKKIYKDNSSVYELNKMAKERYKNRYVDKIDKISGKINIVKALLDIIK